MTNVYYAGIGSRETPEDVQHTMYACAQRLCALGLILRSGAAQGADRAFEAGVSDPTKKEIFLPWRKFENHPSQLYHEAPGAEELAARYHPAWHRLTQGARKMMARNMCQILGQDLETPVLFVICWTPKGDGGGGTGQALRLARDYDIPIFDLGRRTLDEIGTPIAELLDAAGCYSAAA